MNNYSYNLNDYRKYNFNIPNSYALVETNGKYATKITIYSGNSYDGVYDVDAYNLNSLQSQYGTTNFRIKNYTKIDGRSFRLDDVEFKVTGMSSQNFGSFGTYYRFVVLVTDRGVTPIMILNNNNNFGYIR